MWFNEGSFVARAKLSTVKDRVFCCTGYPSSRNGNGKKKRGGKKRDRGERGGARRRAPGVSSRKFSDGLYTSTRTHTLPALLLGMDRRRASPPYYYHLLPRTCFLLRSSNTSLSFPHLPSPVARNATINRTFFYRVSSPLLHPSANAVPHSAIAPFTIARLSTAA